MNTINYKKITELEATNDIISSDCFMIARGGNINKSYSLSYSNFITNISTDISVSNNTIVQNLDDCQPNDFTKVMASNIGNQINSQLVTINNKLTSLNNYIDKTTTTDQTINSKLVLKKEISYNPPPDLEYIGDNTLVSKAHVLDLISETGGSCVIKNYADCLAHIVQFSSDGYNATDIYNINNNTTNIEKQLHTCKQNGSVHEISYTTHHDCLLTIQASNCKLFVYYGCQICVPFHYYCPLIFASLEERGSCFSMYAPKDTEFIVTCTEPIIDTINDIPYYSSEGAGSFPNNAQIRFFENFQNTDE